MQAVDARFGRRFLLGTNCPNDASAHDAITHHASVYDTTQLNDTRMTINERSE